MKKEYVSLGSISKKIFEDTDTIQTFKDFKSEILKRYKELMELFGIDHQIYKDKSENEYKIPKAIEPILLFFLKELKRNEVLKKIRKTKSKDSRLTQEMINFFYNTNMLSQQEKENALYELATTNKNLYDDISSVLLEDTKQDIENIKHSLKYDGNINFINFEERIMLIIMYKRKIKDLLEEITIAKEILDGKSLEEFTYNFDLKSFILENNIKEAIQEAELEVKARRSFVKENLTEKEMENIEEIMKSIDLKLNKRK
ncbi:hypothetical protein GKD08_14815 [Paeniclostridium sordellii]|uniref:hypothetical protein n=1 Tax=Paraclostridium sordellii TaxID=1505 RepID=UPI0012B13E5E|nr:hypothetical protein [Paeniclostridium sordellii]MDU4414958.1 hypothetical protein [Paeniclostridium sordellii]MRZ30028.1 hypothetical protein [Paeniclostridium sordellii]